MERDEHHPHSLLSLAAASPDILVCRIAATYLTQVVSLTESYPRFRNALQKLVGGIQHSRSELGAPLVVDGEQRPSRPPSPMPVTSANHVGVFTRRSLGGPL